MDRDEEIPYRSPAEVKAAPPASVRDENDYSTLEEVERYLAESIEGLSKNFNAFDLSKDGPTLEAQVAGRQLAYDILMPLHEQIKSAINDIKVKQEGQNG